MKERISVTICTEDIATCNNCSARTYESSLPGFGGKIVDRVFEVRVRSGVTRLCKDCLQELKECVTEALQ